MTKTEAQLAEEAATYKLTEWTLDKFWRQNQGKPRSPSVTCVIRNSTKEVLKCGGVEWKDGHWWGSRKPTTQIKPMTVTPWVAERQIGNGGVNGMIWYNVGNTSEILSVIFNSFNECSASLGDSDRAGGFLVSCRVTRDGNDNYTMDVAFVYDPHDAKIPNAVMYYAPASIVFSKDNKIYCFYAGIQDMGFALPWITYTVSTGSNNDWEGPKKVIHGSNDGLRNDHSPAVVEYHGKIYCLYSTANGDLRSIAFDGDKWDESVPVSNAALSNTATAVFYKDKIYCIYQGRGNGGSLWFSIFDGSSWGQSQPVRQDAVMSQSPSAVVLGETLYCFFQGPGQDGSLRYMKYNGATWTGPERVDKVGMSMSPCAIVVDQKIRVYHQSWNQTGDLWMYELDSDRGDVRIAGVGMSESPTAVIHSSGHYVMHQGFRDNRELWSVKIPIDI